MRYIVTYRRLPIEIAGGRRTTDSFQVVDTGSTPSHTVSGHVTRQEAMVAADALNVK
ncbi:MAG TPA: hypothetical protein VMU66_00290 [Gaiellales bacterium]|nr:hypothetical protein [Gaiellales bacterium]